MSRQLEKTIEERAAKETAALLLSLDGGLEDAVEWTGAVLQGFSVSLRGADVLMVIRADFPAGRRVCFVGASDLPALFAKCSREVKSGRAKWKDDKWRANGGSA